MTRPGVEIIQTDVPPPRSAEVDTGTWFAVGITLKGKQEPILCQSLAQFTEKCGGRLSYSFLYDAVETFFREGGHSVYVGRAIGPSAVRANRTYNDAGATSSIIVTSKAYGADYNNVNIAITHPDGTHYILTITYGTEVEVSPQFTTPAEAVAWSEGSNLVTITQGASSNRPNVANSNLTGGTDDYVNITVTQITNSLNLFVPNLGPGQVSAPGYTATDVHQAVANHGNSLNRVALLDSPDTATTATVLQRAVDDRAGQPRKSATFWPWVKIPGLTSGTTRTVPPSAAVAGRIAQIDAQFTPNKPAAGVNNGAFRWVSGLSQAAVTETVRGQLNDGGVNLIRDLSSVMTIYGWVTIVNRATDPGWVDFGNSRLNMAITAQCEATAETYVFEEIDGRGVLFARFGGALTGDMLEFYNEGSLYGETADQAFNVDVGPSVNTPETIEDGELHAVVAYRPSPMAELVTIEIVKVTASGSVS